MTYNHGNYIEEALKGIDIQKTDFSFEVIVGDDFSTDNTLSKIRDYNFTNPNLSLRILDRKVGDAYHKERRKKGRLHNFVDILNNCPGDYIALLDGDDYWTDPLKLQKQVDFLDSNEEYALTFHKLQILKKSGIFSDDFIIIPENYETKENLARFGNYIHTPTVVFRNLIPQYPFEFFHSPFGDFFLYMVLGQYGKYKYLNDSMAVYRHRVGVISKMNELDIVKNNILLYSCMISYFSGEELFKILKNRQLEVITKHYSELCAKVDSKNLIADPWLVKSFRYFVLNYKNPVKIVKRIWGQIKRK